MVATAVVATILGASGMAIGAAAGEAAYAVVLRTLLALLVGCAFLGWAARRFSTDGFLFFATAVVASYVLQPLAWGGRALATQFLTGGQLACFVGDLVIWVIVVGGVTVMALRAVPRREADRTGRLR